jgi:putative intracellular protease/amidase
VVFATETGATPAADPRLLEGVIFGQLGAKPEPIAFYRELAATEGFRRPIPWGALDVADYDALVLPGGHAPGMRQYLGSDLLQQHLRDFWALDRPVAAICHGVLPLARAGVLRGVRTTALTKRLERAAYFLTAWKLGRYYRTYPLYVEDEVRAAGALFERGPRGPFTVRDGRYLSARWPGDAELFAQELVAMLPNA